MNLRTKSPAKNRKTVTAVDLDVNRIVFANLTHFDLHETFTSFPPPIVLSFRPSIDQSDESNLKKCFQRRKFLRHCSKKMRAGNRRCFTLTSRFPHANIRPSHRVRSVEHHARLPQLLTTKIDSQSHCAVLCVYELVSTNLCLLT
jgi:hypothetical protein